MGSSTHHGSPPQLPPAPRRLCQLSSIPSRCCCCPSSSSPSSSSSSSCSSSRSCCLCLSCCSSCSTCSSSSSRCSSSSTCCCCCSSRSGCSSSSSSDGCSCGRSFGVSSFQGFHSFVLMYFINKQQTNKSCLPHARVPNNVIYFQAAFVGCCSVLSH